MCIVVMASYHASNFEDLFLEKISDPKTKEFVICTGYTRLSYIKWFEDPMIDPNSDFKNKLREFLVGDPLGHSIDERKSIDSELSGKVFFSDKWKFGKDKVVFQPIVHSKMIIGFDDSKSPLWALVGSNNFTNNGMRDRNEESMVCITQKSVLADLVDHYDRIRNLCRPLASLDLDRIIGIPMDGGYAIEFTSVSGDAIENILYLEVLVKDEDEMKIVKGSDTVILDCYDESELLNKIRDGKFRLFLLVFVDEVGKSRRGSIVTRYGRSITSIAVERDADVSSSTVGGYINYKNGNIGDFDENRLLKPGIINKHATEIPLKGTVSMKDNDVASIYPKIRKQNTVNLIKKFLNCKDQSGLDILLDQVSDKSRVSKKITKKHVRNFSDNATITSAQLKDMIPVENFESMHGKLGLKEDKELSGIVAHRTFDLGSDDYDKYMQGFDEMEKEYSGTYFATIKRVQLLV